MWSHVGLLAGCIMAAADAPAELTIDPQRVVADIDARIYGHFLEHIYHSVNGGLWGELVWNRSFEQTPGSGRWRVAGDLLVQESMNTNVRLPFGDPAWTDYELSLEARKTGGQEGFLILFRMAGDDDFYWVNLGGWGNTQHAIERGRAGARWHAVGPRVDGAIEEGRWYPIRVRCQGPRFQIWLDSAKIIDWTDDDHPHLTGRAGVGTWATTAEFRNIEVTSLEALPLFEGPPKLPEKLRIPKHWAHFGGGEAWTTGDVFLNSALSVVFKTDGPACGLEQQPFNIEAGHTYAGSIWVRAQNRAGLYVRLRDPAGEVLAERYLAAPGGEGWEQYPFVLEPDRTEPNAVLRIELATAGQVWIDQVSLMAQNAAAAGGFRPDLLEAVAQLRPPIIRWPGGCFASAYDWNWGIGPQHQRQVCDREMWDDRDVNAFGTDEFLALCARVGAEPLLVVNAGSWDKPDQRGYYLQDALDWIEYCNGPPDSRWGQVRASNGHPGSYGVTLWEIDNETWHMGAEEYVALVHQFAPAMRKAEPSIKLGVCGSGGFNLAWNREVIQGCAELVNFLSIHHYEDPDNFAKGPRNYEAFFAETAAIIAQSKNPGMTIYISEWNAQSTDWRTGLYAGGLLNAFERSSPAVAMGGPALFLRHVSATDWDNAFINHDHRTWFPAPNYVVMKLWRDHYAPKLLAVDGAPDGLNVSAARPADGGTVIVKIVNPSEHAQALAVALRGAPVQAATLEIIAPDALDARNTLDAPHRIQPAQAPVALGNGKALLTMPRWSAGVLVLTAGS